MKYQKFAMGFPVGYPGAADSGPVGRPISSFEYPDNDETTILWAFAGRTDSCLGCRPVARRRRQSRGNPCRAKRGPRCGCLAFSRGAGDSRRPGGDVQAVASPHPGPRLRRGRLPDQAALCSRPGTDAETGGAEGPGRPVHDEGRGQQVLPRHRLARNAPRPKRHSLHPEPATFQARRRPCSSSTTPWAPATTSCPRFSTT